MLPESKDADGDDRPTEQANNGGRIPAVVRSSPFKRQKEHHRRRDEHGATGEIDSPESCDQVEIAIGFGPSVANVDEEEQKQGQATERKVYVETFTSINRILAGKG